MINVCSAGSPVFASNSPNTRCCSPLAALITTTGESACKDRSRSVIGGTPVCCRSRPGTWASTICEGEKPSLRFHSAGSTRTPCLLAGRDSRFSLTRRPVIVPVSATVKTLLGQGNMQLFESRISQRSELGVAISGRFGAGACEWTLQSLQPASSEFNSNKTSIRYDIFIGERPGPAPYNYSILAEMIKLSTGFFISGGRV